MIYTYVLSGFQDVENQRVERNIRSVSFVIKDKIAQLDSKLADWAIWDDTYDFMMKKNQRYIDSNLSQGSFEKLGVDEVLFIDNDGSLRQSYFMQRKSKEAAFPKDLYNNFATGSALITIDKKIGYRGGILKTEDGIILFSVREVLKSDGSGPARGRLVFAFYFDSDQLTSLKEITQFKTSFITWTDLRKLPEFPEILTIYTHGEKKFVKKMNSESIAGYVIVEDVYGKPQGVLKMNIERDITLQGKASMVTLMIVLIFSGLIGAALNYWLMSSSVLKKIFTISQELKDIGKSKLHKTRLLVENSKDEIDMLRININTMLGDIEASQNLLKTEVEKQESLIELINSIVVMLDSSGNISMINKKGCEILGYSQEELIGKDWINTVLIPEEQEMTRKKFIELINSNQIENIYIENSILTKDKKIIIYGWHTSIIKNGQGITISTLSVGNNITQIKKEERIKEDYTDTLKRMNDVMIGRELKMMELKKRIVELENKT